MDGIRSSGERVDQTIVVGAEVVAARHGLQLVDWIACDDQRFRSMRLHQDPDLPWVERAVSP